MTKKPGGDARGVATPTKKIEKEFENFRCRNPTGSFNQDIEGLPRGGRGGPAGGGQRSKVKAKKGGGGSPKPAKKRVRGDKKDGIAKKTRQVQT